MNDQKATPQNAPKPDEQNKPSVLLTIYNNVKTWLRTFFRDLPRVMRTLLRHKTGRRLVAGLVVAGLAAFGVDAPFEVVAEALRQISVDASPLEIALGIIALIFTDGTFRANETWTQALRIARPNRTEVYDEFPLALRRRFFDRKNKAVRFYEYDAKRNHLVAVSEDGDRVSIPPESMTPDEMILFKKLKDSYNGNL